jgi:hypothetical protein
MKKNIIIAVLLIGLIISAYFNYRDSDKVKIKVGTDYLNLTFYTIKSKKDSMPSRRGMPEIPDSAVSIRLLTTKSSNSKILLKEPQVNDCYACFKQTVPGPIGVYPPLEDILFKMLHINEDKKTFISIELSHEK